MTVAISCSEPDDDLGHTRRRGRPRKAVPMPSRLVPISPDTLKYLSYDKRAEILSWRESLRRQAFRIRCWVHSSLSIEDRKLYYVHTLPPRAMPAVDCALILDISVPTLRRRARAVFGKVTAVFPDLWRYLEPEVRIYLPQANGNGNENEVTASEFMSPIARRVKIAFLLALEHGREDFVDAVQEVANQFDHGDPGAVVTLTEIEERMIAALEVT